MCALARDRVDLFLKESHPKQAQEKPQLKCYCLDELRKTDEETVIWTCDECFQKAATYVPNRKSKRVSSRRYYASKARKQRKKWRNEIPTCLSAASENVGNLCLVKGANGNQDAEKEKRKPLLFSETSSGKDSDSIKVESLQFVSCPSEECFAKDRTGELGLVQKFGKSSPVKSEGFMKDEMAETATYRNGHVGYPCVDNGAHGAVELPRQKRKLVLQGDSSSDEESLNKMKATKAVTYVCGNTSNSSHCPPPSSSVEALKYVLPQRNIYHGYAHPLVDAIWRGCFSISNERYGTSVRLAAHLSSKASLKVSRAAAVLPPLLNTDILPRDKIIFDSILTDIVERDLALKAIVNNVDLLVFSSRELPQQHWRFCEKYYLWGIFRQKQDSLPQNLTDNPIQNINAAPNNGTGQFKPPVHVRRK